MNLQTATHSAVTSLNFKDAFPDYFSPLFSMHISWSSVLIATLVLSVFSLATYIYLLFFRLKKQRSNKHVLLEIKPPSVSLQSSFSTEKLFTTLHSFSQEYSFWEKLLKLKKRISLEIVSTKYEGIRYILSVPEEDVSLISKNLIAYIPAVVINRINDFLPKDIEEFENNKSIGITEFKLKRSFVLPLQGQSALKEYDPIAYITAHMTKLEEGELVLLQFITTPVTPAMHGRIMEYIQRLHTRIYKGKEIVSQIQNTPASGIGKILQKTLFFLMDSTLGLIQFLGSWLMDFVMSSRKPSYQQYPYPAYAQNPKQEIKELTPRQKEIQEQVERKINENLFEVSLRLFIINASKDTLQLRERGIISSFATFDNNSHQAIKAKKKFTISYPLIEKLRYLKVKERLLSFTQSSLVLSTPELTSLYHFPFTKTTQTEDILTLKSSYLPAPLSLKKANGNLDIKFAFNSHGGINTPIGLFLNERRQHIYIIGKTGSGKSTLLLKMTYEDIVNGKGLCIVDPHGDMTEKILRVIPEKRIKDIIYFNPYDIVHPVGINLLELPQGLSTVELQREKDLIASSLLSIFHKLYGSLYFGPRMEHILRNTILSALELKEPTFETLYSLLANSKFRKRAVKEITDPILITFWNEEFNKLSTNQRADVISPITNKLGRFLTTSLTRNILNQKKSKLDFEKIMNKKKILICNLSKGNLGEDISSFLGSLIIAKLQLAALRRVQIPEEERVDFFLYIDEFQNFATEPFAQLFSEARKYRLNIALAHQNMSQIKDRGLLDTILANAGTIISFRTGSPDDEGKLLSVFGREVASGQISNLPAYHFYMKVHTEVPQDTFSGETENFAFMGDDLTRNNVISYSQKTYGSSVKMPLDKPPHAVKKQAKTNGENQVNMFEKKKE